MPGTLEGRRGVVTGASGPLGRAIASELARQGVKVLLLDNDEDSLAVLEMEIAASGGQCSADAVNIADASDLDDAVARFQSDNGPVDLLVVATDERESASFGEGDPQRWMDLVRANLLGPLFAIRAVLSTMLGRRSGHIVLVSDSAGSRTSPGQAVYSATKWGVAGIGHALRAETEASGIKVTLVEPGVALAQATRSDSKPPLARDLGGELGGQPVARAVLFALQQPSDVTITEVALRWTP